MKRDLEISLNEIFANPIKMKNQLFNRKNLLKIMCY